MGHKRPEESSYPTLPEQVSVQLYTLFAAIAVLSKAGIITDAIAFLKSFCQHSASEKSLQFCLSTRCPSNLKLHMTEVTI